MGWFSKQKNTITVEFIESGNEIPFAVSDVPIDQLPDSFEIETKLDIGEQQWMVAQAIPTNKTEFVKSGKVQVFLNKIEMINPKNLLFSLPTINDSLFQSENVNSTENIFQIHEDDWRQVEFISTNHQSKITDELNSIKEIYRNHKKGDGFDKVHIRNLIEQPLISENIKLQELIENFRIAKKFDGFGLLNTKSRARNGFAFQTDSENIFFGQVSEDEKVLFLCLANNEVSTETLRKLIDIHNVVFVDWCQVDMRK